MHGRLSGLACHPKALPGVILAIVVGLALLASWRISVLLGLPLSANEFNLARWESQNLPSKWLYELGSLGRDGLTVAQENDALRRYLSLEAEVAALEDELLRATAGGSSSADLERRLAAKRGERDGVENQVEAILEGRIGDEAVALGLERSLPLFSDVDWLFPPVDFEFDSPPRVLVTSPRERIELDESRLLRSDLALEDVLRIEAEAEDAHTSALVVRSGGVATYPSTVPPMEDYVATLKLAAHEWLHQYLFFQPLGAHYFDSVALRTINETVADIAGDSMGGLVAEHYPLAEPAPGEETESEGAPAAQKDPDFLYRELRALRLEVDRLLADGRVGEAEALMEEKRQYLEGEGFFIRKINQAYFAFHGLYGTSGASSSPIGPKLEELRRRVPSLGEFVRAVSRITSEAELDRLLASYGG